MTMMRLTGRAGRVNTRKFDAKIDPATGAVIRKAFMMRSQDIEIAQFITTPIDLREGDEPLEGFVDVVVEVSPQGRYLRVELRGNWPEQQASRPRAVANA